MAQPGGHYAKWNKLDSEWQYYIISLICGISKSQTHSSREWNNGYQGLWVEKSGNVGQRVQTFSYKMSKFWTCNVYLKLTKRVDLQCPYHTHKKEDAKGLEMDGGDSCTTTWMDLTPQKWTLTNGSDGKFYVNVSFTA